MLQGAVDVVMEALRQIEAFEEAVQAQEMASARGDRSGGADVMTAAQACARLRKLISQVCFTYNVMETLAHGVRQSCTARMHVHGRCRTHRRCEAHHREDVRHGVLRHARVYPYTCTRNT